VKNGSSSFVGQDDVNPLTTSPCMSNFMGIYINKIDPVVLSVEKLDELNPQFLTGFFNQSYRVTYLLMHLKTNNQNSLVGSYYYPVLGVLHDDDRGHQLNVPFCMAQECPHCTAILLQPLPGEGHVPTG